MTSRVQVHHPFNKATLLPLQLPLPLGHTVTSSFCQWSSRYRCQLLSVHSLSHPPVYEWLQDKDVVKILPFDLWTLTKLRALIPSTTDNPRLSKLKLIFSWVGNDHSPSQKSRTQRENRNTAALLNLFLPIHDLGSLYFHDFVIW